MNNIANGRKVTQGLMPCRYTLHDDKVEFNSVDCVESRLLPKPARNRQQRELNSTSCRGRLCCRYDRLLLPRSDAVCIRFNVTTKSTVHAPLSSLDHRLRGSASTVLTATGQVNGRWRNLTPHRIETHESTATKFRTIDYVRERTP